jgi:hypothetical protein
MSNQSGKAFRIKKTWQASITYSSHHRSVSGEKLYKKICKRPYKRLFSFPYQNTPKEISEGAQIKLKLFVV